MPPDIVKLSPVEKLGKFMLYDHTLSNPSGYACATCHVPEAGLHGTQLDCQFDFGASARGRPGPEILTDGYTKPMPVSFP